MELNETKILRRIVASVSHEFWTEMIQTGTQTFEEKDLPVMDLGYSWEKCKIKWNKLGSGYHKDLEFSGNGLEYKICWKQNYRESEN